MAVHRKYKVISGVSATIPGKLILRLARVKDIAAITPDVQVQSADYQDSEMWRDTTRRRTALGCHGLHGAQPPAIAIVDSGIDASKTADFGDRVVASVNFSSLQPERRRRRRGPRHDGGRHRCGRVVRLPGAAPNGSARLVRTADENGMAYTSDVIAGVRLDPPEQGHVQHPRRELLARGRHRIELHVDPLDKAVEKLWFNGVVVVAAAGNYGTGDGPVRVSTPPATTRS